MRVGAARGLLVLAVAALGAGISVGPARAQTDPLLEDQWHLKARTVEPAGANVRAAWPLTEGLGVVIGIVDDGLQHTHPDLSANYVSGLSYDFNNNDPDPSPGTSGSCSSVADCHGTAVAGVAAARGGNGIGVSGAAPRAGLAGLRLISAPATDADEAASLSHESDQIHISSNSWGPADNGTTLDGPGPLTRAAMASAVATGRGGKGRIFAWAAGNGRGNDDNCNFDGYANSRYVIAVAALTDAVEQAWYSEPCAAMFVTAPSSGSPGARGITTTDLVGTSGYEVTGDYTSTFGGTSSSAPLLSGAVALVLAQNPALTWRDVKEILRRSSVRVNPGDPGWTAGAFPHSEKFGFGLIDGQAAVSLATGWSLLAPETSLPAVTHALGIPIPDNNPTGVSDTISISGAPAGFAVEHIEVEFDATHTWRGDLTVTLTSPAGVTSRLATQRSGDSGNNFAAWRFGTVRHWGEAAGGTWTLTVSDLEAPDAGTWNSWTLRIYGRSGASGGIAGTVTSGGVGLGGVTVTLTGAGAGATTTAPDGSYAFAGLGNGSYTVTPSLTGCTFVPPSRAVAITGSTVSGQDFAASCGAGQDLVIEGLGLSAGAAAAGGGVQVSYTVRNQGTGTVTAAYAERLYLSPTATLGGGAVLLATTQPRETDLGPAGGIAGTVGVQVPVGTAPGSYFLLVEADALGAVAEGNEGNNVSAVPITVWPVVDCPAFIVVDNLAAGASSAQVSYTGTWAASAIAGGYGGGSLESVGAGADTYTWGTGALSAVYACTYQVAVAWVAGPGRGAAVPYTVSGAAGGSVTKTYDQRGLGGQFLMHGVYTFPAGGAGAVTVSDAGGQASADAVIFSLVGATLEGEGAAGPRGGTSRGER